MKIQPQKPRILIVDDEFHSRQILRTSAEELGYEVVDTASPEEAKRLARFEAFDILITDLKMPTMDGIQLLESIRLHDPQLSVVVVTAHGSIETAVDAMKKGAEDYLLKPIELPVFELMLQRIQSKRALIRENIVLRSENSALKKDLQIRYHLNSLIGRSESSQNVQKQAKNAIRERTPLIIIGEHGTGKKDLTRMIHYNSPWGSQTLLHFDCSSVPEALREAQLFGSPDLGAIRGFPGLIERSHLGTLVLTNVHDLSEDIQTKLARVIQEERTYRSGGQKFYPVSIRLIFVEEPKVFADIVKSGKLSLVLLRAFGNNKILLSPLRERREDIPVLTLALIKEFETKHGFGPLDIDKAILSEMSTLPLHENIAELRGRVAEAFQKSDGKTLTRENFFGN